MQDLPPRYSADLRNEVPRHDIDEEILRVLKQAVEMKFDSF